MPAPILKKAKSGQKPVILVLELGQRAEDHWGLLDRQPGQNPLCFRYKKIKSLLKTDRQFVDTGVDSRAPEP